MTSTCTDSRSAQRWVVAVARLRYRSATAGDPGQKCGSFWPFPRRLEGRKRKRWPGANTSMSTTSDPDVPQRALAAAHPSPGRPSAPIRLLPARLVALAPEHERAAVAALAALLAHDYDHERLRPRARR